MLYGIDVSRFQAARVLPWGELDFVIARAAYGTTADRSFETFARRTRSEGAVFGAYQFWVPSKNPERQLDVLEDQLALADYADEDTIPWLDVERYPLPDGKWAEPHPSWSAPLQAYVQALEARLRRTPGIYLTRRDWQAMGSPEWVLRLPQWVAHWIGPHEPRVPGGRPWVMHQYRVGPYDRGAEHNRALERHPLAIDHDRAEDLPRWGAGIGVADTERPPPSHPIDLAEEHDIWGTL